MTNKDDHLIKKARRAEKEAKAAANSECPSEQQKKKLIKSLKLKFSFFIEFIKDIALASKRVRKIIDALASIYRPIRKYGAPVFIIISFLWSIFVKALKFAAFKREEGKYVYDEDGDLIFCAKRFGKVSGIYLASYIAIYVLICAIYFYGTKFEKTVYTTDKGFWTDDGHWYFTACDNLTSCSTENENSYFYEIKESWIFPYLIYPEEDVFASIPKQNGECKIKGFGVYFKGLKIIHKNLKWYQDVYNVDCHFLGNASNENTQKP